MAWPHFMPSSFPSSANSDHTLKPSIYFLNAAAADNPANNAFGSAAVEDHLFRNLYAAGEGEAADHAQEASGGPREVTLEDYLTNSMVARVEDGKAAAAAAAADLEDGGNLMMGIGEVCRPAAVCGGRGRKRPAVDSADRAALQRQKRMIKNRESAARSRERKQQYTNQLEQTVFKLEEENAILLKEREELMKLKFKQLTENVIPVAEKKKPQKDLRRTNSFP